jgi:hypothetical protein
MHSVSLALSNIYLLIRGEFCCKIEEIKKNQIKLLNFSAFLCWYLLTAKQNKPQASAEAFFYSLLGIFSLIYKTKKKKYRQSWYSQS